MNINGNEEQPFGNMLARLNAMTPEQRSALQTEQTRRMEQEERARRFELVRKARGGWGAPKRQESMAPDCSGRFGTELEKLTSKLGSGFFVVLIGIRGSGKTQIGVELMKRRTEQFKAARFCTAIEFFMLVKSSYKKDSKETEESVLETFQKPALLVIDEIGRRGETDWENNLLFELLNRRYNDMSDTLLTCNLSPEELEKSLGSSLISRLSETGGVINCDWKSFRQQP